MAYTYVNGGISLLGAALDDADTSMTVATGNGALFAGGTAASPLVVLVSETGVGEEIIHITAAMSGDTAPTILRAQEAPDGLTSATALTFTTAATVRAMLTKVMLDRFETSTLAPLRQVVPAYNNVNANYYAGTPSYTPLGTLTARSAASTNYFTSRIRAGYVSAASTNSAAGAYPNQSWLTRQTHGFAIAVEFGISDASFVTGAGLFVGLTNNGGTLTASAEPSAATSIIGAGGDSADTTLHIMHNDGSGTATKVDLGVNFPINTTNVDWYRLELFQPLDGASAVIYRVTRLNTMHVATGVITTDLPASTYKTAPVLWRSTLAASTATGIDFAYIQTRG